MRGAGLQIAVRMLGLRRDLALPGREWRPATRFHSVEACLFPLPPQDHCSFLFRPEAQPGLGTAPPLHPQPCFGPNSSRDPSWDSWHSTMQSQQTGWTPDSSAASLLSQEGHWAPLAQPGAGVGTGFWAGLGCVGSKTQKAQCLALPGPALLWELGRCPAQARPGQEKGHVALGLTWTPSPTQPSMPGGDSHWV